MKKRCLVEGCLNTTGHGVFVGNLCSPCHEMITTGKVHHANRTFIGVLAREAKALEAKVRAALEALK